MLLMNKTPADVSGQEWPEQRVRGRAARQAMGFAGGAWRLWKKKARRSNGSRIGERARTSSRKRYCSLALVMIPDSRPRLSAPCTSLHCQVTCLHWMMPLPLGRPTFHSILHGAATRSCIFFGYPLPFVQMSVICCSPSGAPKKYCQGFFLNKSSMRRLNKGSSLALQKHYLQFGACTPVGMIGLMHLIPCCCLAEIYGPCKDGSDAGKHQQFLWRKQHPAAAL